MYIRTVHNVINVNNIHTFLVEYHFQLLDIFMFEIYKFFKYINLFDFFVSIRYTHQI